MTLPQNLCKPVMYCMMTCLDLWHTWLNHSDVTAEPRIYRVNISEWGRGKAFCMSFWCVKDTISCVFLQIYGKLNYEGGIWSAFLLFGCFVLNKKIYIVK